MTFDGTYFYNSAGRQMAVVASKTKAGRWQYRSRPSGTVIASGMTPRVFAAEYWFASIEDLSPATD